MSTEIAISEHAQADSPAAPMPAAMTPDPLAAVLEELVSECVRADAQAAREGQRSFLHQDVIRRATSVLESPEASCVLHGWRFKFDDKTKEVKVSAPMAIPGAMWLADRGTLPQRLLYALGCALASLPRAGSTGSIPELTSINHFSPDDVRKVARHLHQNGIPVQRIATGNAEFDAAVDVNSRITVQVGVTYLLVSMKRFVAGQWEVIDGPLRTPAELQLIVDDVRRAIATQDLPAVEPC